MDETTMRRLLEENKNEILGKLDSIKAELEAKIEDSVVDLRERIDECENEIDFLKTKIFELEKRDLRKNVMFYNIPERNNRDPLKDLTDALKSQLNYGQEAIKTFQYDLDMVFRIGKPGAGRPRPLKAIFFDTRIPKQLFTKAKDLKGVPNAMSIGRDQPEVARRIEGAFKDEIRQARQARQKVKWSNGNFYINGELKGSVSEVPSVPPSHPPRDNEDPDRAMYSHYSSPRSPPTKQARGEGSSSGGKGVRGMVTRSMGAGLLQKLQSRKRGGTH